MSNVNAQLAHQDYTFRIMACAAVIILLVIALPALVQQANINVLCVSMLTIYFRMALARHVKVSSPIVNPALTRLNVVHVL